MLRVTILILATVACQANVDSPIDIDFITNVVDVVSFAPTQGIATIGYDYTINKEIEESINIGKQLVEDVESILADPEIPVESKQELEMEIQTLINEALSGRFRRQAEIDGVERGKICCKVIIPPKIQKIEKVVSWRCTTYYSQPYTKGCGAFGWKRCHRTRTASRIQTCYRTDISYVSIPRPCPVELKTCCRGHFWFREVCIEIARFEQIMKDFVTRLYG